MGGWMEPVLDILDYSFDAELIAAARAGKTAKVAVYRVAEPMVVLGRGSRIEREIFAETCVADEVPVLRRSGGGCAVVLDSGNLVVSVAMPCAGLGNNKRRFDQITGWLIGALEMAGIGGVKSDGISDLVLDDRKISGSCIHQWKDAIYFSGTLLVDPQLALMEKYLRHPPREPAYRRGRPHAQFCGALASMVPGVTTEGLKSALQNYLDPADLTPI